MFRRVVEAEAERVVNAHVGGILVGAETTEEIVANLGMRFAIKNLGKAAYVA